MCTQVQTCTVNCPPSSRLPSLPGLLCLPRPSDIRFSCSSLTPPPPHQFLLAILLCDSQPDLHTTSWPRPAVTTPGGHVGKGPVRLAPFPRTFLRAVLGKGIAATSAPVTPIPATRKRRLGFWISNHSPLAGNPNAIPVAPTHILLCNDIG